MVCLLCGFASNKSKLPQDLLASLGASYLEGHLLLVSLFKNHFAISLNCRGIAVSQVNEC